MYILVAPDKFRGSLEASEVCRSVEEGIRLAYPDAEIISIPLADGGEGTTRILTEQSNGHFVTALVHDPFGRVIKAEYGLSEDRSTAFIEMAAASGLALLQYEERNPLITSTFGTGELILHALNSGVEKIILGIGGSATTDGGIVYFSTNFTRFVLDAANIKATTIKDITKATMPFDFEGKLKRWCYKLIK